MVGVKSCGFAHHLQSAGPLHCHSALLPRHYHHHHHHRRRRRCCCCDPDCGLGVAGLVSCDQSHDGPPRWLQVIWTHGGFPQALLLSGVSLLLWMTRLLLWPWWLRLRALEGGEGAARLMTGAPSQQQPMKTQSTLAQTCYRCCCRRLPSCLQAPMSNACT